MYDHFVRTEIVRSNNSTYPQSRVQRRPRSRNACDSRRQNVKREREGGGDKDGDIEIQIGIYIDRYIDR